MCATLTCAGWCGCVLVRHFPAWVKFGMVCVRPVGVVVRCAPSAWHMLVCVFGISLRSRKTTCATCGWVWIVVRMECLPCMSTNNLAKSRGPMLLIAYMGTKCQPKIYLGKMLAPHISFELFRKHPAVDRLVGDGACNSLLSPQEKHHDEVYSTRKK